MAEGDYYLLLILLFGVFLGLGFDLLHFLSKRKGQEKGVIFAAAAAAI